MDGRWRRVDLHWYLWNAKKTLPRSDLRVALLPSFLSKTWDPHRSGSHELLSHEKGGRTRKTQFTKTL